VVTTAAKSETHSSKSGRHRLAVKLAVVATVLVVSLLLVLIAGEVFLRIKYADLGDVDNLFVVKHGDSRPFVFQPGVTFKYPGGYRKRLPEPVVWRINREGYRADKPTPPNSDRFRVLVFGDSEAFGWAVNIEHSFGRLMEQKDRRVEVLNLSIPGYNAENVADHMAVLVPKYRPDMIFYLFAKNDMDPTMPFYPWLMKSRMLLVLALLYNRQQHYKDIARRKSPVGERFLRRQIERMAQTARRAQLPFLVGILNWHYRNYKAYFPAELHDDVYRPNKLTGLKRGYSLTGLNLSPAILKFPRYDKHMSPQGHMFVAQRICAVIAGSPTDGCIPPGWSRRDASR
jgi:hypothetical protein